MNATCSSKKLVTVYHTTWCHNAEDLNPQFDIGLTVCARYCCENSDIVTVRSIFDCYYRRAELTAFQIYKVLFLLNLLLHFSVILDH